MPSRPIIPASDTRTAITRHPSTDHACSPHLLTKYGLKSAMEHRPDDITLQLDRLKLTLSPSLGASIVSLSIKAPTDGHNQSDQWSPVLREMRPESRAAADAGSFAMLPWTNRIKDSRFDYQAKGYALRSNADDGSAIHGVGRGLPWQITDRSPITARLVLDSRMFDADELNYPFAFGAVQRFEIGPDELEVDLSITNLDQCPIPVGCGHHPYFHRHLFSNNDELSIKLDVAGRYPTRGCIPIGEPGDDEICAGFRTGRPIANPRLDDVFSGFGGVAVFDWAASNVRMTMRCTDNLNHVVIYTPRLEDGSADEFVCVEPVTMVNDGFNRHAEGLKNTGVVILNPNETLRTRMTLAFSTCS